MTQRIQILAYSNGSYTFKNLPPIYQGSVGNYYIDIEYDFKLENPETYIAEIMFRRNDGKATGYLPLDLNKLDNGNVWTKKLDKSWYFEVAGTLASTIRLRKREDNTVIICNTFEPSFEVIATNDLYTTASLIPSAYDDIIDDINTLKTDVDNLEAINTVVNVIGNIDATLENGKATSYAKVKYYDETENTISINLPDGLATEKEVDDKINDNLTTYNPILKIEESNNNLEFKYETYINDGEHKISIKLPEDISRAEDLNREVNKLTAKINEKVSDVVRYDTLENGYTDEPLLEVYSATKALADGEGNNIVETYATKEELTNEINTNITNYEPINEISAVYVKKDSNKFYIIKDATEPNLYYAQDIASNGEVVEKTQNVIVAGTSFEAIYLDDSILDATFTTAYGTGTNINIGTFTWDGSSSVTQNFTVYITSEGKIHTLRVGWGYNLIANESLSNQTIIMKNYNSMYDDATSATLTINSGYDGLFAELQPYLYIGKVVEGTIYNQSTYNIPNEDQVDKKIDDLKQYHNDNYSQLRGLISNVETSTADLDSRLVTLSTKVSDNKNRLDVLSTVGLISQTTTSVGTIPSGSFVLGVLTPTAYCIAYNNGINQTTTTIFYGGENCYVPLYTFNDTTQTYDVNFNDYLYISEYNGMHYLCRSSSNIDWTYCYKIV